MIYEAYGYCLLSNVINKKLIDKSTTLLYIYHSKSTTDAILVQMIEFPADKLSTKLLK